MNWRALLIISGILLSLLTLYSIGSIALSLTRVPDLMSELPPSIIIMWIIPTIVHIFVIVSCFGAASKMARQETENL